MKSTLPTILNEAIPLYFFTLKYFLKELLFYKNFTFFIFLEPAILYGVSNVTLYSFLIYSIHGDQWLSGTTKKKESIVWLKKKKN